MDYRKFESDNLEWWISKIKWQKYLKRKNKYHCNRTERRNAQSMLKITQWFTETRNLWVQKDKLSTDDKCHENVQGHLWTIASTYTYVHTQLFL